MADIENIIAYMTPRDRQTVLSMMDGEPAALGLGDALMLGMSKLTTQEQRVDGFYYTLNELGREVGRYIQGHQRPTPAPIASDSSEVER